MFEPVIGIEVHLELCTRTKAFCSCSTSFGAAPNSQVCPVCLGLPGSLPVLNKRAVEYAIKASLALNCNIASATKFDRKNYFYPDLVKGYQISQFDMPIGSSGYVDFEVEGEARRVRIRRVHLEEDTGKSFHVSGETHLDYNRSGVPLIEIVTEPDIRSAPEAKAYLEALREILVYTDISDCRIEEGSMRCEANVSLRPVGSEQLGVLNEIKNIGSLRGVQRAIEYEIERQRQVLTQGHMVVRQTRRWNEQTQQTEPMRSKEEAHDYRYFPDPDLVQLRIDEEWISRCRAELPELPAKKRQRLMEQYGLPQYDASELTADRALAAFYEQTVAAGANPRTASNWLLTDIRAFLNTSGLTIEKMPLREARVAELLMLLEDGTINSKTAKDVLVAVLLTGDSPREYVESHGLGQITDYAEVESFVRQAIENNPQAVEDYRAGKERALKSLVGAVMKLSRGKANPELVNEMLKENISR